MRDQQKSDITGFRLYYGGNTSLLMPNRVLEECEAERQLAETNAKAAAEAEVAAAAAARNTTELGNVINMFVHKPSTRVQVFDPRAAQKLIEEHEQESDERSRRMIPTLELMRESDGQRRLIERPLTDIMLSLARLKLEMPNFKAVIDILSAELALAMADIPAEFRLSCLCMDGVPGIGKTRFASQVAEILDVGFDQISLGASQGSFELAGVAAGWGNSRPGRLSKLLAQGETACPVVLLDEMDKIGSDDRFPTMPVLLDLLEQDTARRFRDEALEIRMDASKIIFLATSNDRRCIPDPLQSRIRIIQVEAPSAEQRRGIVERMAGEFERVNVQFSTEVLDALAEYEMDLRALARHVRELAGKTLASGETEVRTIALPKVNKQSMGFIKS